MTRYVTTSNVPLVSIIIVNFNGKKWLDKCLSSLSVQSFRNLEIILVDNRSTDDSVLLVKNNFPKVKVVEAGANLGFAGGNNEGVKHAKGKYILLLNNDTYVENDFVEKFLDAFNEIPRLGIVQSKIVLMNDPEKLDTCGAFWTDTSFLYYVGNNKDESLPKYNKPFKIFAAKGASVLIKRELIEKVGLFDNDFWSYYEETDFCHRAWIAGYEVWYWPKAVCYHAIGGTSLTFKNDYIQFHNFKNKLCSYIKNLEPIQLLKVVPIFLFLNTLIGGIWLLQGKVRHTLALYKSLWWNVKNIPGTYAKRKTIQKTRKNSDAEIWRLVKKNPSLQYYRNLFADNLGVYSDK